MYRSQREEELWFGVSRYNNYSLTVTSEFLIVVIRLPLGLPISQTFAEVTKTSSDVDVTLSLSDDKFTCGNGNTAYGFYHTEQSYVV